MIGLVVVPPAAMPREGELHRVPLTACRAGSPKIAALVDAGADLDPERVVRLHDPAGQEWSGWLVAVPVARKAALSLEAMGEPLLALQVRRAVDAAVAT